MRHVGRGGRGPALGGGIDLKERGDYQAALERYRAAVEIRPQDPLFRKNLGLAPCRRERWAEAKAELREVLRVVPGEPDALEGSV